MTYNRNHLSNGHFLDNIDHWTAAGGAAHVATDGDPHLGCAHLLAVGDSISQEFVLPRTRIYTLHYHIKEVGNPLSVGDVNIEIYDSDDTKIYTHQPSTTGGDDWETKTASVGLIASEQYTLKIDYQDSHDDDIHFDHVWLWEVAISRSSVATIVHDRLGALATDKGLSTTASGDLTEGDYTYAVDSGLRRLGAVDPVAGLPDIRWVEQNEVDDIISLVLTVMLEQLQIEYSVEVDIAVGPRRESLSQISKAIGGLLSGDAGGGLGTVVERDLSHE